MNAHFLIMCFRIFILTKGKTLSPTPSSLGEGNFPMRSGRNAETSSACQSLHKLSNELVILSEKPLDCNKSAELERRISNFSRSVKTLTLSLSQGRGNNFVFVFIFKSPQWNKRLPPTKISVIKAFKRLPPPRFSSYN